MHAERRVAAPQARPRRDLFRASRFARLIAAGLLGLALLLRFQIFAGRLIDDLHRQTHFPALIEAKKLDLDLVAFFHDVGHFLHAAGRQLANVHETVLGSEEVYERTEVHHLDHRAFVDVTDFGLGSDRLDPVDRRLHRIAVGRCNLYRPVVGNIDLRAGLFDDLADHLAAGADHFADLVDRNVEHFDARRVLAELSTMLGERLAHFAQDVHAPVPRLAERNPHDLLGDPGDLDVHL